MPGRVSLLTSAPTPLQSLIFRRWRPQWICQSCRVRSFQRRTFTNTTSIPTDTEKPYYITTPIFYVNAAPHVGHMYTMVLTDVIKRWQVLKGRQAILCTGTDEHGMKIQQAAAKAGVDPKMFCDKGADVFRDLAGKVDLSNDIFIRTTDRRHRDAVEYAWHMLQDRGLIYESKHEGWYSVSDETFYPRNQIQLIVDPPTGRKIMVSIETGKQVEWTSERNYHFRLSKFKNKLLEFYRQNPEFVVPRSRMEDVLREVSQGLRDLSVSRPSERLTWGVRVPTDRSQTIYVWLDALLSYASAAGYPFTPGKGHVGGWPADVHVIGKDIVRFHAIYWPAFLMALDLPLPKQVLTHAHWTLGKQKMAKSTGNVVNPLFALERFGMDAMRWYLVHDGGIAHDADYDNGLIFDKYRKSLQGGLGNLSSRVMRSQNWDVQRAVHRYARANSDYSETHDPIVYQEIDEAGRRMLDQLSSLPGQVDLFMQELLPNRALQAIMGGVYTANAYIQHASPWTLATKLRSAMADTTGQELHLAEKEGHSPEAMEAEIDRIIYLNAEMLRLVGIMLQSFIPTSAKRLLDMLGVVEERRSWEWCEVGHDDDYGTPFVELGKGEKGVLFPGLTFVS